MALTNLNQTHFSDTEKNAINTLISSLETALQSGLTTLTAEERQQYGSVNEQNKLVINKVKEYRDNQPNLSSPDVNWAEFGNDYASRAFKQNLIQRLQALIEGLTSSKVLHDFDNYRAALDDYAYSQYKMGSGAVGYDTKVQEIKQFFSRSTSGTSGS